jgi:hypothetical protein
MTNTGSRWQQDWDFPWADQSSCFQQPLGKQQWRVDCKPCQRMQYATFSVVCSKGALEASILL